MAETRSSLDAADARFAKARESIAAGAALPPAAELKLEPKAAP